MASIIIIGIIIFCIIIILQLGKIEEANASILGSDSFQLRITNRHARYLVLFCVFFLLGTIGSALYYKNSMLGYGPHLSASAHGVELDKLFNLTLFFTGIVFVLTHIFLFYFAYKYRRKDNSIAKYFAHSTKLEMIWTGIPALVMAILIVKGLYIWNNIMYDLTEDQKAVEFEATGYQFAWDIRYPGPDGKLGRKDFRLIDVAKNPLGIDWTDPNSHDDFMPSEIVLPVDTLVKVHISAKDVLHSFYLPHFRLKMDAVPGMPTYFVFKPKISTADYQYRLSKYAEWNVPSDPNDENSPKRYETFEYELACAELCGKGHWSMRKVVKIVSEDEYKSWYGTQKSFYVENIKGTELDPNFVKPKVESKIEESFEEQLSEAIESKDDTINTIQLDNILFETASASLKGDGSKNVLDNIALTLDKFPNIRISIDGHTDNVGNENVNQKLSEARAITVKKYLVKKGIESTRIETKGFGSSVPVEDNGTEAGRVKNRRIEMRIL